MILFLSAETPMVKGYNRTCIYDLPKGTYDFIPNSLYEKLLNLEHKEKDFVYKNLDNEEKKWLEFLIKKEYCFFANQSFKDCFIKINFDWKNPSYITNAIIDIEDNSENFNFKFLEDLNCKHILIRFSNELSIENIINYIENNLKNITFKSVDIVYETDTHKKNKSTFRKILKNYPIISSIQTINSLKEKTSKYFRPNFVLNTISFSESQSCNLYFNQKLYLNPFKKYLKNSPNSLVSFEIKEYTQIKKIIDSKKFKSLWKINKDKIDVCKDCEFRYMCFDDRIPEKRNDKEYFHKTECEYNPYLSLWSTDEKFISLQQLNVLSNKDFFQLDNKHINNILANLWD